jgi:hypothetical protein
MSLKEKLNNDLRDAMRSKDKIKLETIRSVRSAIKYAEIEAGQECDDAGVLVVITKQAKQRRDSIAEFEKAKRADLVAQESAELAVLEQYLPAQLSEADIKAKAAALIAQLGITDAKGIGVVMKHLMADLQGQADGKIINQIVRQLLNS